MNRCPPEILEQIFAFACLDDGTTGCSLSLVSTKIRAIANPFRYQSLKLSGIRQLDHFKNTILGNDEEKPGCLGVKYLMLESRTPFRDANFYETTPYGTILKTRERQLKSAEILDLTYRWRHQLVPLIQCIMEACSTTLVMLHIETHSALLSLAQYPLPHLEELHVLGNVTFDWSSKQLPRLRRLRLPELSEDLLEQSSIPSLEILRVWARTPRLKEFLDKRENDEGSPLSVCSVRRLLLELHKHEDVMKEVIEGKFREYDHVLLVPSRRRFDEKDWWDSVNGGLGCFVDY